MSAVVLLLVGGFLMKVGIVQVERHRSRPADCLIIDNRN